MSIIICKLSHSFYVSMENIIGGMSPEKDWSLKCPHIMNMKRKSQFVWTNFHATSVCSPTNPLLC